MRNIITALFDRRFAVLAKREAAALRENEERFRILYRKTPLPLHSLDQYGIIEHVSDAWLELVGYGREEVVGRRLEDFLAPSVDQRRVREDWSRLVQTGSLRNAEYRFATRSGQCLDVLLSASVERNASGQFVVLGGLVDVTAHKLAEEALRQAQKMEVVGQLTGGVAHDFNNLLSVVLGNLELLRLRLADDAKALGFLENALQGAERGASLTQRMLTFARRQEVNPGAVDVPELVLGMGDLLQRSIGPMSRIEISFPEILPKAHADGHQLELALVNLLVNARDAMEDGKGVIRIAAREEIIRQERDGLAPGGYLCLSVSDNGCGMDEATLARATEPFFTTKGVGKGTGLGLSMVRGLAAEFGGQLFLTSRKGQGTTAEIWLPTAVGKAEMSSMGEVMNSESVVVQHSEAHDILVVDDDALVLMGIVDMLQDLGHRPMEAPSGKAALEILRSGKKVDLVLTDQAMPDITGLQLAEIIRQEWPGLPVILATGYQDIGAPADLPQLRKPFYQQDLARAIAALPAQQYRAPMEYAIDSAAE
jgi:PAS domain S-box-containing protein